MVGAASVSIKGEKTAAEFVGAGIFAVMALEKAFAFFAGAPAFAHMGGEKPSVESVGAAAFASMAEENTRAKIARPVVCQVSRSLCFKRLLMTTRNIWCTLMRQRAHFELSIFSRLVSFTCQYFHAAFLDIKSDPQVKVKQSSKRIARTVTVNPKRLKVCPHNSSLI